MTIIPAFKGSILKAGIYKTKFYPDKKTDFTRYRICCYNKLSVSCTTSFMGWN